MKTCRFKHSGFTLVEMAIVLVIVGLLLGGMLMPLSAQMEQRRIGETQKTLDEINQALIGFAIANKRLPRPATSATDGAERAACATQAECTGFIPWSTLGVSKLDAWNHIFRYKVALAFTTTFALTTAGNITVQTRDSAGTLTNLTTTAPAIVLSQGKNGYGSTADDGTAQPAVPAANIDESANATGAAGYISSAPSDNAAAPGGAFDDIVAWLSPNILFNRMVAANQLP
jgi:prepilin-type N-terminal cleavage/methylation domain-containing protein